MLYLIIFIILLILSAFFSGTETAYFHIRQHRDETTEKVNSIVEHPRKLLVSLLTGSTIVYVSIASLAAYITHQYALGHSWNKTTLIFIEVIVVSTVVLIFGEIMPKMIAIHKSEKFAELMYKPLKIMLSILYPFAQGFYTLTKLIMKIIPLQKEKIFDSEEE